MDTSREMLYYTEEETIPEDYKKKGNKEKWPELKNFFWNPYYQEFVGRDALGWGKGEEHLGFYRFLLALQS